LTPRFEIREEPALSGAEGWATRDNGNDASGELGFLANAPLLHLGITRWVPHLFAFLAKRWDLLAQAEPGDDIFIALGIVGFQIVEQATPLADQHEKSTARAVIFQVRFEVFRQLTNALA